MRDRAEMPNAIVQSPIINMAPKARMSGPWETKLGKWKPMEHINTLNSLYALRGIKADGIDPQEPVVLARSQPASTRVGEHPLAVHTALPGGLWMVDHNGATVLRCRCLAVSATWMWLCVPAGYGVAVGQRYELSARDPGEQLFPSLHAIVTLWVTVVQMQNMTDEDPERIDVAVVVDPVELNSVPPSPPRSPRGRPIAV
jgi:hypothetical protein